MQVVPAAIPTFSAVAEAAHPNGLPAADLQNLQQLLQHPIQHRQLRCREGIDRWLECILGVGRERLAAWGGFTYGAGLS